MNSAQIHKVLEQRKIKKSETVQEYFLAMKELSKGIIENEALFEYVIDGLDEDPNNTVNLYGAKTLSEFKEKLKIFEKIRNSVKKSNSQTKTRNNPVKNVDTSRQSVKDDGNLKAAMKDKAEKRCFNYGDEGHLAKECDKKLLGTKCFNCNKYGHLSRNCTESKRGKSKTDVNENVNIVNMPVQNHALKDVTICNKRISALIDTGSPITLIREDLLFDLKNADITLTKSRRMFSGFGNGEAETQGYIQTTIYVDDEDYPITLYVVPKSAMNEKLVIGRNLLESARLEIDQKGIKIIKTEPSIFLSYIELPEQTKSDIDQISDKNLRDKVENLISSYSPKRSKTTNIKLKIILKDESPIYQSPRRLSFKEGEFVNEEINNWLETGIIEPCSLEFASPVVVVKRKNGSFRLCVDYRQINKVIVKDRHPLPLIDDETDKLVDGKVFCTLDLKNGFLHVDVDDNSKKYTAFVTHKGPYEITSAKQNDTYDVQRKTMGDGPLKTSTCAEFIKPWLSINQSFESNDGSGRPNVG